MATTAPNDALPTPCPEVAGRQVAGSFRVSGRRTRGVFLGLGLVAMGVGLLFVATMVLDHQGGLVRWLVALAGLALLLRGVDGTVKANSGPESRWGYGWLGPGWSSSPCLP